MVLQARGRVAAHALASEFEVSIRTIYRDVDELSASGVPVQADRGPGGGFRLSDGYRTQLTGLTPDEAETLLLSGLPGAATDLGFGSAMASAERKVLAALPAVQSKRASQARQRVLVDPLDWYRSVERPRHLAGAAKAVWNRTPIVIRYESWTMKSRKTIEPLGLVIKAGVWYVVARRRNALRTYRVGQIFELKALKATFEAPADFNLAAHWAAEVKRFEKGLHRGEATIQVAPEAISRMGRLGADALARARESVADRHGWRTVKVPIEGIDHAALELLGFGPFVKVVSPAALAKRVRELADQTRAMYGAPRRSHVSRICEAGRYRALGRSQPGKAPSRRALS